MTASIWFLDLGIAVWGLIIGVPFLYAAWFHQTNHFVKQSLVTLRNAITQTSYAFYNLLVTIKNAIVSFFQYTWDHRIDILRAFLTIIGFFLIILPFFLPFFTSIWANIDPIIRLLLIFIGFLSLYVAWFHQTNHFVKQTLIAFRDAIIQTGHAVYNFLVAVKNTIVQAVRSAYLATIAFLHYTWDHRIDILRALATLTGPLMILRAIFPDLGLSQPMISLVFLVCGFGLLYAAWFVQVNQFIKQSFNAIRNAFVQAAHSIYNFLVAAKAAFIKAFYTVAEFLSKALTQLGQLIVAIIDSIILILSFLLAISAIFYGIVLILSGIIDPSGEWTKIFLADSIPILGHFIELIAKFVQNFSLDILSILESEVDNLLGAWANQDRIILIILGVPFIAPGVILGIIGFLMRDSIKLSSLKKRIRRSDSQ